MRLALINHHDSFVFNLYQYLAELLGSAPEVISHEAAYGLRDTDFDAWVISPGPGHPACPADMAGSVHLIAHTQRPLLGVCLGHQAIVTVCGGTVGRAPEPVHGRTDLIRHDGSALYAGLPAECVVMRYHSLCAYEPLPACLQVNARNAAGLVMGVTHRQRPIWGVQFHPESIASPDGRRMLGNFLQEAARAPINRSLHVQPWAQAPERVAPAAAPKSAWQVHTRCLSISLTPETVFEQVYAQSDSAFWLDSAASPGRFSFMGDAKGPASYQLRYRLGEGLSRREANRLEWVLCTQPDPWAYVESLLGAVVGADTLPFDFCGGWVGYWGYELKALTQPMANRHVSPWPDAWLTFADRFLAWDAHTQSVYLVALLPRHGTARDAAEPWFDTMQTQLEQLAHSVPERSDERSLSTPEAASLRFELEMDKATYMQRIAQAQAAIAAGDSYELCLTNRLRAVVQVDPWALYRCVRRINPAPYAAYLACADFHVLCASPELFLKVDRDGQVQSEPIKGTRPRHALPDADAELAADLAQHPKDRAENLMIVDLVRNDLGRVCNIGSVSVPALLEVRTYATVHQLISRVAGQLRPGHSALDALKAAFPGGSMTGAPKLRSMTLLDDLESSARGVYSGCLGYVAVNGAAQLGMVIRTLVRSAQHLEIGMGGAIISLSDPAAEFAETLVKARALLAASAWCATGDPTAYQVHGGSTAPGQAGDR